MCSPSTRSGSRGGWCWSTATRTSTRTTNRFPACGASRSGARASSAGCGARAPPVSCTSRRPGNTRRYQPQRLSMMRVIVVVRWLLERLFAQGAGLRFQVREHHGHIVRPQTQIGHPQLLVLAKKDGGDRIAFGQHLVRNLNVPGEPRALAACGHARQVRPQLVALPDTVARAAPALEKIPPRVRGELVRLGVAVLGQYVFPAEKSSDAGGEERRIVERRVLHPLPGQLVAEHHSRDVVVARDRVRGPRQV